jgi:solute carrier family 25 phosphate transporter 3
MSSTDSASPPIRDSRIDLSPSIYDWGVFTAFNGFKVAAAGAVGCGLAHGSAAPFVSGISQLQIKSRGSSIYPDIFKNQLTAKPFSQAATKTEGWRGLWSGLGATALGYSLQGMLTFGGVEVFKVKQAKYWGDEAAWKNRFAIYASAAALSESILDVFLCPLEACRLRLVQTPDFAPSLSATAKRIFQEEGFMQGFYSDGGPLLFKRIPYTATKFLVQGYAAEAIASSMEVDLEDVGPLTMANIDLVSGLNAGVAAAVVSHPAYKLRMKIMQNLHAGGSGRMIPTLKAAIKESGTVNFLTTGLGTRCMVVGLLTMTQFGIYGAVMNTTGATRFQFREPPKAGAFIHPTF